MIRPVDLGICRGYEYGEGSGPTAIALPGAMLAGMPVLAFAIEPLAECGWRVVHIWDEYLDRTVEPTSWVAARLDAAVAYAGEPSLLLAKSLGTRAAGRVAREGWPAVWLTPLLRDEESLGGLRARTAPALAVGGTKDPEWDGGAARELFDDVLELEGADHGLARIDDLGPIVERVGAFADRVVP